MHNFHAEGRVSEFLSAGERALQVHGGKRRGASSPSPIGALIFIGDTLAGTADDDFIAPVGGVAGDVLNGNGGDDVLLGDPGDFILGGGASIAAALNIDTIGFWTTSPNPLVENRNIPHAMIYVEATAGESEFYAVSIGAGETISIDVEFASDGGFAGSDQTELVLFDAGGVELERAFWESGVERGAGAGSFNSYDPYLEYTVAAAGTYFIQVRESSAFGAEFDGDEEFAVMVSVTGHATGANVPVGADTLRGGDGRDFILGYAGNDSITGGEGSDELYGGGGIDTVSGGPGNDTIFVRNGENIDDVAGGADIDGLDLTDVVSDAVSIDLAANSWTGKGGTRSIGAIEIILGTQLNDTIDAGGSSGYLIYGEGGSDWLIGGSNFQFLVGGEGNDTIEGGSGDDEIHGGPGDDFVVGGNGADTIQGTAGADTIDGNVGIDLFQWQLLGPGIWIDLGSGFTGGAATGTVLSSIENLEGSNESDTLSGDAAVNMLDGGEGNDLLHGSGGDDELYGDDENDTLAGGAGGDALDGGLGIDWASYEGPVRVRADLLNPGTNTGDAAGDSYTEIENLFGSERPDILRGDNDANVLDGGDRNDVLRGRGGDDTLIAGLGFDRMEGQGGADHFVLQTTAPNADVIEDFEAGTDLLSLDAWMFSLAPGALDPDAFVAANSAQDAEDRLVYRAATGKLYYDPDGTGAAAQILIATLENLPVLTASDFVVT